MTAGSSDPHLRSVQYGTPANLQARMSVHMLFSTNQQGWPDWLFGRFELASSARILDIGCGPGAFWSSNAQKVPSDWRLTLTDFSAGMAEAARDTLKGQLATSVAVADAQWLPFPDEAFDAVMAHHMLYHVPDKPAALTEIARVLRPGESSMPPPMDPATLASFGT